MLHRSKERCACYGVGQTLVSSEQGKSAFHEIFGEPRKNADRQIFLSSLGQQQGQAHL
jgi:hypothetical protein